MISSAALLAKLYDQWFVQTSFKEQVQLAGWFTYRFRQLLNFVNHAIGQISPAHNFGIRVRFYFSVQSVAKLAQPFHNFTAWVCQAKLATFLIHPSTCGSIHPFKESLRAGIWNAFNQERRMRTTWFEAISYLHQDDVTIKQVAGSFDKQHQSGPNLREKFLSTSSAKPRYQLVTL